MKAIQLKTGARGPALHLLFTCLVIGAMLTVPVPAAAQKNMNTPFEEIKSEAQRLMDEIKVPGTVIGIINDGKVEMAGVYTENPIRI